MERRRYQRLLREVAVDVTYKDSSSKRIVAVERSCTRNISAIGLLVVADKMFGVGENVNVQFFLPNSEEEVKASARIVRVEEIVEKEAYELGLEFSGIDETAMSKINKIVIKELSE